MPSPSWVAQLALALPHIRYELETMVEAYALAARSPRGTIERKAGIESTLQHVRVLAEFLGAPALSLRQQENRERDGRVDMRASMFCGRWNRSATARRLKDRYFDDISKWLSHTSWRRIEERPPWDLRRMVVDVLDVFDELVAVAAFHQADLAAISASARGLLPPEDTGGPFR